MTSFLQWIEARRYGALVDRKAGPFAPGLNAVYGPNETGKTSFASLVGGVLFGWSDSHGVSNTYQPEAGDRSGALVFLPCDDGGAAGKGDRSEPLVLERTGSDSLQGDTDLVRDVDSATYRTLFSLTSDELLALRDSSDVTARLLAAGSGTSGSPAAAFVQIEQQIAALTAPGGDDPSAIPALEQQLDGLREQIRDASREVELAKQDARELRELRQNRADAAERLASLNREIGELAAARDRVESCDARIETLEEERAQLEQERRSFEEQVSEGGADPRLLALNSVQERTVRSRLDEYEAAWEKMQRIVDTAKQNRASSQASYEAFLEMDERDPSPRRRLVSKGSQAAVSVIPTLAFIGAGVALFIHGRHIGSLSFTALGAALIVLAFLLAAAGAVLLLRPDRHTQSLDSRRQDAQWVMLQDKKKLDGTLADADQLRREIAAYMEEAGLGDAGGSLRQGRLLMDEAAQVRMERAAADQRLTALDLRIRANREEAQDAAACRADVFGVLCDLPQGECSAEALEAALQAKTDQRDALQDIASDFDRRIGELGQRLQQVEASRRLDALKLECQQVRSRLRESKHGLVELLLAKRMLERSMALWESTGKPQVYRDAGQLLSLITGGRWVEVSLAATGSVVVRNAAGDEVKPRHLSLGTCQQLYLALRIALLLNTPAVGCNIPVLADDILVNFDGERRDGAAEALARLAQKRQVIVFTCHRETVEALGRACPDLRTLEL